MQIADKKVVTIIYELYISGEETDFEIVEVVGEDEPMIFLMGKSGISEEFEKKLMGLKAGDEFEFELPAQSAFGEFSELEILQFPIEMFNTPESETLENFLVIGNYIPFTKDDGTEVTGSVHEIKEDFVSINFNHPLAGKNLRFEGEVLEVRDALENEFEN